MTRKILKEEILAAKNASRERFSARLRMQRRLAKEKMKKGAYLLPSMLTIGSVFMSFWAIILVFKHQEESFVMAAWLLFGAFLLDGMDGAVARLTNTSSEFGVQLDSLADVLSFGIAPALLMYGWVLHQFGRLGWVAAFLFLTCGACRLARFNVQATNAPDKRYFTGLPIPIAALTLASVMFNFPEPPKNIWFGYGVLGLVFVLSYLMVSRIKYRSFKDRKRSPRTVALIAAVFGFIAINPEPTILFGMVAFAVSGPIALLWSKLRPEPAKPTPLVESLEMADLSKPETATTLENIQE